MHTVQYDNQDNLPTSRHLKELKKAASYISSAHLGKFTPVFERQMQLATAD